MLIYRTELNERADKKQATDALTPQRTRDLTEDSWLDRVKEISSFK